jgi:hypothetical protein
LFEWVDGFAGFNRFNGIHDGLLTASMREGREPRQAASLQVILIFPLIHVRLESLRRA